MTKIGGLFRNNYDLPQEAQPDSVQFRVRMSAAYRLAIDVDLDHVVAKRAQLLLGVKIGQYGGLGSYKVEQFIESQPIGLVLSLMTLAVPLIRFQNTRLEYIGLLRNIVKQENMLFDVDDQGGFHPKLDAEFARNVESAIGALDQPGLNAVKAAYEEARKKLTAGVPDYKGAVRDLFEAMETAFTLACDGKQLTDANVENELRRIVQRRFADADAATQQTTGRAVGELKAWAQTAHPYRHGHPEETPFTPPDALAILQFSVGSALLRWLVDFVPRK